MKFRHLDLSNNPINLEHKTLGIPPLERSVTTAAEHPVLRIAMWLTVFLLLGTLLYLLLRTVSSNGVDGLWALVTATLQNKYFWSAVLIGLIAQIIDGALGMAYGVTSTTFLLASGSSPAVASASVHLAEVFTTGVSGISHVKFEYIILEITGAWYCWCRGGRVSTVQY
ncbi:TSUP family transporter [Aurantivibrio infirmus]